MTATRLLILLRLLEEGGGTQYETFDLLVEIRGILKDVQEAPHTPLEGFKQWKAILPTSDVPRHPGPARGHLATTKKVGESPLTWWWGVAIL